MKDEKKQGDANSVCSDVEDLGDIIRSEIYPTPCPENWEDASDVLMISDEDNDEESDEGSDNDDDDDEEDE